MRDFAFACDFVDSVCNGEGRRVSHNGIVASHTGIARERFGDRIALYKNAPLASENELLGAKWEGHYQFSSAPIFAIINDDVGAQRFRVIC